MSAALRPATEAAVIPAELRAEIRWVTWDDVDGKKLPSGRGGPKDWQRPESWMGYEEALGRGRSIGFVLGGGFSGLDLDDCLDPSTRRLSPIAEDVLHDQAVGCYAEVSPSGTGLKIFGRSSLPGVELHFDEQGTPIVTKTFPIDGSYFTVTGDALNGHGLGDLTPALEFWSARGGKDRKAAKAQAGKVGRGGQHNALVAEAGSIRRRGHDDATTFAMLRAWADARLDPRPSDEDVWQIVRSTAEWREDGPAADMFPMTESGDAEFFAATFGDRVRYDHRRGRFLVFDGDRWAPQTDGEIDRLALAAVRARQAAALSITGDDVRRRERQKWAIAGEARKRRVNMLALAQSVRPVADAGDDWDADPWLLGVRNGVVDLRSGELRPGAPEDRITMRAAVAFDPAAACPLWDRTVGEIFGDDQDLVSYFDRLVGYSLTGDCRDEMLPLCYGTGGNGKGTIVNTLSWILGDYADDLPFSSLELHERGGIPNDIAKLVGKRFVTSSEGGEARRLNEARVKALTGRDPITARFLHREFFTFQPVAKFWLSTNHRPVVRDTSLGFWRRLHLIPFTRSFAASPDRELKDRLRGEAPGILARAVRGCLAWQRDGLRPPQAVLVATEAYRVESMPLARFIEARCLLEEGARATSGELFAGYVRWCDDAHEASRMGRNEFREALRERFKIDPAVTRAAVFLGVKLTSSWGEL